jgi:hypothetical protein
MAPTSKKKGAAPAASASKLSVVQPKKTRAEKRREEREAKRAANKERYHRLREEETKVLQETMPSVASKLVVHGATPKPSKYDTKLANRICLMFASDPGMSLLRMNSDPELPTVWHFYEWLQDHPDLEKRYARAREMQTDLQAAELERWTIDPLIGTRTVRRTKQSEMNGEETTIEVQEYDNIERSRLRADVRRWLLSKYRPKKYGTTPDGAESGASDQLEALFAALKQGPAE